ncbi:RCC1/BLIP-II [Ramaria rubella]|nr:RCC1/BLIP-II [Ramaria rubella]
MSEQLDATATTDVLKNDSQQEERPWGRGGTRLGKKDKAGVQAEGERSTRPDLLQPHILRSLANVNAVSIHTSPSSCHCIVLDTDGSAWLFGRNNNSALGVAGADEVSENAPKHVTPHQLKAAKGTKFVHAACGKTHSLLVGSGGELWSVGLNNFGQVGDWVLCRCGHSTSHTEISNFKLVDGPKSGGKKENVIKAAAGVTFSIVLTDTGKVYSFGSGEKGQLGNGRTGEHITTGNKTAFDAQSEPLPVKGLTGKTIVDIAAGNQHSIILDSEGFVYVFGYNGYCRLGLGDQQDVLVPKVVPHFAGPAELTRGYKVAAGPSNSVVIDKNRMYWMAGKWKNSGDGSSGQPYTTFKYMPDIMGCKISHAASGGVTHFALCPDDDNSVMTIAWGQNAANGELGLGDDEAKSATKPLRVNPLNGVNVFYIAAGQNTTFFLARPNQKLSDLPRHPIQLDGVPQACVVCEEDKGDDDDPLECEKASICDAPYHLGCLDPPLSAIPDDEWFCPNCTAKPGAPIGEVPKPTKAKTAKASKKHKEVAEESEPVEQTGGKRKVATSAPQKGSAPKRRK